MTPFCRTYKRANVLAKTATSFGRGLNMKLTYRTIDGAKYAVYTYHGVTFTVGRAFMSHRLDAVRQLIACY